HTHTHTRTHAHHMCMHKTSHAHTPHMYTQTQNTKHTHSHIDRQTDGFIFHTQRQLNVLKCVSKRWANTSQLLCRPGLRAKSTTYPPYELLYNLITNRFS